VSEPTSDRWYVLRRWMVVAAFVPALLAEPGRLSADTKVYLSVDPGRLLSSASSMWDPSVGAGTVPHQNIGYLFPLGPWYWLFDMIGAPDWVAQRLLWGLLVFTAAWGACRLGRLLGWSTTMAGVTGLAYGFSPYLLSYLARLSVILLPWAAMPWLIVLTIRLCRRPTWPRAAAFAGVIALIGSVNATSLVLAGLGPIVWLVTDTATRRASVRSAADATARIGLLSLGVSAWWIAGLSVQGAFGLPILRFTETYRAIAGASTPAEVVRGLGYWFFYGGDRLDHWVGPSSSYTNDGWLILLGFGVAMLSLLGLLISFPRRGTFVAMLAVGMIVSVGGAPTDAPTLYGSWFADFASDSTIGGALRSTTRAMPLVVLALGAGLGALTERSMRFIQDRRETDSTLARLDARLPVVAAVAMLTLQFFPWFIGTMTTDSLLRSDVVPDHVDALAQHLDAAGDGRVLIVPGSDFAYPRVGGTIDPILPGVLDRPVLYRELVPQGSEATADLLNAYERRLHDGWAEPEAWPVIARLFDATAIAAFNDHQYERFRLARPGQLWPDLVGVYGAPDHVGPTVADETITPLIDSITYADPDTVTEFPIVAAWSELPGDASPIDLRPASATLVLDGTGDGVVDLSGSGLLTVDQLDELSIRYLATVDDADALDDVNWWVVTDTNRKQGRRWSTIGSNLGPIEPIGAPVDLADDPGDQRLDVFGSDVEVPPERMTVAEHDGAIALVQASWTGSRIAYTPEDAPFMATDGDPTTAWRTAVFDDARGLELVIQLREPADSTFIEVVQPVTGVVDRFITEATVTLGSPDGSERSIDVVLDERSRQLTGQRIELPDGPAFTELRFEIVDDNLGPLSTYAGRPGVGLAEISIGDQSDQLTDHRVVRMPVTGDAPPATARLTYVMTRERIDPATQNRFAPEPVLRRAFDTPARAFELGAELRLSTDASDEQLAAVLGIERPAVADRRLRGSVTAWAGSAVDDDPSTAWLTPIDASRGARITVPLTGQEPSMIGLEFRDDPGHSLASVITLSDGASAVQRSIALDDVTDGEVRIDWPAELDVAADSLTITVDDIVARTAPEYFSGLPQELPVGLSELSVSTADGTSTIATAIDGATDLPAAPFTGLLDLDGAAVPLCLMGQVGEAIRGQEIAATACEGSFDLASGAHRIDTARGVATGLEIDRVVLDSSTTGQAQSPSIDRGATSVVRSNATSLSVRIAATSEPAWLVLQESWNTGWTATADGRSLGDPELIDGYANGWLLDPGDDRIIELEWTPQSRVRVGVVVSLLSGLAILALLALGRRRGNEAAPLADGPPLPGAPTWLARSAVTALAMAGVLTVGIVPTLWGVVVGIASARGRAAWLAPVGVIAAIGVTGAWITVAETLRDHADSPDWPSIFSWTAPLVWIAVAGVVSRSAVPRGTPTSPDERSTPSR